ncbi:MAG TPA: cytochrome c-type biogenesis CcmF C-terminal domain-containing protein [Kofleriaceae bacterium]|nr:cytochrome c-type biogenesis CcmF C-terminal domain-containing protein [Kofleriaceae bacterium]
MNTTPVPFSPIALVGTITLLAAYLIGAWSAAAGIAGNARRSRRLVNSSVYGLYAFGALTGLASALIIYAFVTHDFSIKYVAMTSDVNMSIWYKVTAFWGGLDGSLLFWVLVLGLFSVVAVATNAKRHRDMIGYVVATIMIVQIFFLSLLIFHKNPFATFLTEPPKDGSGLNPLLQNYWMVIHPPVLYIGFVSATIPFAFGIGALASGRLDDLWIGSVRVWMLICFLFLSVGLVLGGRWAYEELGWGGYWAWDPVENAGLIPWFTATAFLHSSIIQEQRGMMKQWNLALVIFTFFLTIFGTFMTRSGVVQSVHAFGEDNVLALQFILFMALTLVVSVGLVVYRSNKLSSRLEFESFFSREFSFLLNNWILLGCAFFVLFATMFPTISEALDGARVSVGIEFFNKWMTPLGLTLLFLAGAAPLLAWRMTTSQRLMQQFLLPCALMAVTIVALVVLGVTGVLPRAILFTPIFADAIKLPISIVNFGLCAFVLGSILQEIYRGTVVRRRQTGSDPVTSLLGLILSKRRKYGGYIVHLGVATMFIGFGGKAYDRMEDRTIEKPAIADALDKSRPLAEREAWSKTYLASDMTMRALPQKTRSAFTFAGYTFLFEDLSDTSDDLKTAVTAQISIWNDGEHVGTVYPAKWTYRKGSEATTEVAIKVRAHEDVYVVLTGYDLETKLGNFRVFVNPLISWVWLGTLILAFGTLICLIPQGLIDRLSGRAVKTRLGRAAELAVLALVVLGVLAGLTSQAHAQAEHVRQGMGMGDESVSYASKARPQNNTEAAAMKELLCPCGCKRESIFMCKCGPASDLRSWVQTLVNEQDAQGQPRFNLATEKGRDAAYEYALDSYVARFGEQTLATPRSSFSWIFPSIAVVGGLGLLFVAGRRVIARGRTEAAAVGAGAGVPAAATATAAATASADDKYVDKLDDELADTD